MSSDGHLLSYQQRLIEEVQTSLAEIDLGSTSKGIVFVGDTGSGKTFGLDALAAVVNAAFPNSDHAQRLTPCCRIEASAKADAMATASAVLQRLGRPVLLRGRTSLRELERQMHSALAAHRVRVLILEEMHNAMLAGTPQLRHQMALMLKNLWNSAPSSGSTNWTRADQARGDVRFVFVLSGTRALYDALMADKELESRFSCVIEAPRLDFYPEELFKEFRLVVRSLAVRYGLSDLISVNNYSLMSRFLLACTAHLRILSNIIERASTLRRRMSPDTAVIDLMAEAHSSVGGLDAMSRNPFRWTEAELANEVVRARDRINARSA